MAGGASVPPSSSLADGRAARRRRIEPRARLRGAEAGLAAAGLGSGDARAGHGRPQLASPRLVPDRSRGGGARAEVRRRGALPAQAERLAAEFVERAVKALDVCNAARDGVDQARRWERLAGIAASVLLAPAEGEIHEGQLRRARKALADLSVLLIDDAAIGAGLAAPA